MAGAGDGGHSGPSKSTANRIWRNLQLKPPHLTDTFRLSPDPLFVEKVHDVVGLHVNPHAESLCPGTMGPRRAR